ncbi:MAG: cytochrome c biogenesis protein CcsA, partial [Deferribacterales bacterium]|nr:cytochrome c biogenesis protein CcsA [Deferribacterales bacterium]
NFPPLETINNINIFALYTGFVLFSGGIVSGIIWGLLEWNGTLMLTSKLVFSFITWIVFAVIIIVKKTKGLTPKKTATLSIIGILLILLTYHGVATFLLR